MRTPFLVIPLVFGAAACAPMPHAQPPAPVPPARYAYAPAAPCSTPGAAHITVALVTPRWVDPNAPKAQTVAVRTPQVFADLGTAMRADFLQLMTCRGYLAKGPFESFDAMVFPDREGSQLLLEPELQINIDLRDLNYVESTAASILSAVIVIGNQQNLRNVTGTATVSGRVTLNLKEPVTNTRMWTRSIDLPGEAFEFVSEKQYQQGLTADQARGLLIDDPGLLKKLVPQLEAMYGNVLKTAEKYMDVNELNMVATQAGSVRKKAAIAVPQ